MTCKECEERREALKKWAKTTKTRFSHFIWRPGATEPEEVPKPEPKAPSKDA